MAKFRLVIPVILGVTASSCVHVQRAQVKSSWHPISKVKEISCKSWPLREKDLRIEQIIPFSGHEPGFFASVMKRDASRAHYFAPMGTRSLGDPESFIELSLSPRSFLLGGSLAEGKSHVVIGALDGKGPVIEKRLVSSNVIDQKIRIPLKEIDAGSLIGGLSGDWIILQDGEGRHHAYFLTKGLKTSPELIDLRLSFSEAPKAVSLAAGALFVWREENVPRRFKMLWLGEKDAMDHRTPDPQEIEAEGLDNVESWAIGGTQTGALFVAVVGDSLLGEASLKFGRIKLTNKNMVLEWIGRSELRDIHVTEPFVIEAQDGGELLLVNWVDEESTIARYIVNAESISKPVFTGLFAHGTRIVGQLLNNERSQKWVLTRHRIDTRWVYQICGL